MTNLVKKVKIIMYFYALKGYFLLYFKCMKIQNIFKIRKEKYTMDSGSGSGSIPRGSFAAGTDFSSKRI